MSSEVTQLLAVWHNGDQAALDKLMPLVYDELRRLAKYYLSHEPKNITLQPTALVNEAYLKLVEQQNVNWENRAQFFGLAAKIMRNILVDSARRRNAAKRGNAETFVSLSAADRFAQQPKVDLIALDDAMNELAKIKSEHAKVVELRYFGGLTIEETATVMNLSHATIERSWSFARAWLKNELQNK